MTNLLKHLTVIAVAYTLVGCGANNQSDTPKLQPKATTVQLSSLNSLAQFTDAPDNWHMAEDVFADRGQKKALEITKEGDQLLVNLPTKNSKKDLYTQFDHQNLEIEFEVMMPKGSNSGFYFQSRYELQLKDSWAAQTLKASDIGGIYFRWANKKTYEGTAPPYNASRAPGLWQKVRAIFEAPQFEVATDGTVGKKIKNAVFKEVWLNGSLMHKNIEVTGPTRSAPFSDERPTGPLMIQGDHGPVAFRNIRYRPFNNNKVTLKDLTVKQYKSESATYPDFATLEPVAQSTEKSLTLAPAFKTSGYALIYEGVMDAPEAGEYFFELNMFIGQAKLLINDQPLFDMSNLSLFAGEPQRKSITLPKGDIAFKLVYNKVVKGGRRRLELRVTGPDMFVQNLHDHETRIYRDVPPLKMPIVADSVAQLQRGFMMHHQQKKTHIIAVGTPEKINYAFDLEVGALIKFWRGDFVDAANMWHGRGMHQLMVPLGSPLLLKSEPVIAQLDNDSTTWPTAVDKFVSLGYKLDNNQLPSFVYQLAGADLTTSVQPFTDGSIGAVVSSTVKTQQTVWMLLTSGDHIKKLPDGVYHAGDHYIKPHSDEALGSIIRTNNGRQELLVKLPSGEHTVSYDIIW
jgi:3-keto-disaccharide hydrolase